MTLEELLTTSTERFRSIVDQEVRENLDEETANLLRSPEVVDRWRNTLIIMKKSVESQLGAKREDLARSGGKVDAEYRRWKAGALRFKNGVELRLLEIRSDWLKTYRASEWIREERNEALFAYKLLSDAVRSHKEAVLLDFPEDEVTEADLELWRVVGA